MCTSGSEYPLTGAVQTYSITNPADGRYELTATDTAGNRTFAAFSLGTSVLAALPEGSTAAYDGSADIAYSFPALFGTGGFTRDFNLNPASATYKVKMYNAEGQVRDEAWCIT